MREGNMRVRDMREGELEKKGRVREVVVVVGKSRERVIVMVVWVSGERVVVMVV